jgi:hypothetical protein
MSDTQSQAAVERFRNPLLQQVENQIVQNLDQRWRDSYFQIVNFAMKVGMHNGRQSPVAGLIQSRDPIADAANGAIALVLTLWREANGNMPVQAMIPAATTLMLKGLEFIEVTRHIPIDENQLVRAAHIYSDTMLRVFHVDKRFLAHYAQRLHGLTQDPAAMELINRKAGFVRHPDASEPTPGMGGMMGGDQWGPGVTPSPSVIPPTMAPMNRAARRAAMRRGR